ncbi:MAG: oligopeptide transporter, OPT family [Gammaproteobacteria bacterium]|nr:oligopeptide transporter, OPT family [Gammaproteobacteria bacterium]
MSMPAPVQKELTIRGVILGVLITLIFTAANVFFGLKAGLTFATSIPAAVISMAILRSFKGMTIQENNIVQTIASAAGTLSAIIFVLPGLVMIGWWTGFPYWTSVLVCGLGGILGVLYSIPLRRALVTQSDLPYPEGLACAEVLKVGGGAEAQASAVAEARAGLHAVIMGSVVSGVFALVVGTRIFASDLVRYFRVGSAGAVTGFDLLFSFALFGVGHLVGLWVGVAMGVGALIAWGWGVPHYSALGASSAPIATLAHDTWSHQVRFVGAGTILIAAIWTLAKLVQPVAAGLRTALAASRARRSGGGAALPRTEQDIPIGIVGVTILLSLVPIGFLLADFDSGGALNGHMVLLVTGGLIYIALMSFFVSAVVGYMAGLIGSSNSPLSGIGILAVLGASLLLIFGVRSSLPPGADQSLVAYALFVTAVVFAVGTIANNNLQDLKTGQLVDATPWKQQVALIIGVVAGAVIIPPILDLLNHAYGFAGSPGPVREHALPAPQAGLISALAQGVLQNKVDWSLIGVGLGIGAVIIVIDETLRRVTRGAHLSPLAVGLGLYLPTQSTLMVVLGAVAGWYFDRRAERRRNPASIKQLGVLLASGMIVGEGLVGVVVAALVAFSGKDFPLSLVGDHFADNGAVWLGSVVCAVVILLMYRWVARLRD